MLSPGGQEGVGKGKKRQRWEMERLTQNGKWDVRICRGKGEYLKVDEN